MLNHSHNQYNRALFVNDQDWFSEFLLEKKENEEFGSIYAKYSVYAVRTWWEEAYITAIW
jgi:hypothetical protein